MNFAYYIFLLLIIFLCFFTIKKNLSVSPKKIKIYFTIVIILLLMRHLGLVLLCILESSKYIYYLKAVIYLDNIAVPLIVLAVTYVYSRSERLKFTGSYFILAAVTIVYVMIMHMSKVMVNVSSIYGFIMEIDNELIISMFSLILIGIMLIINVLLLDKKYVNKKGIWFIIIAVMAVMIEKVIILGGVRIFPYSVIGELIFIMIINFVLSGFKKIK
ncbi:hypothetical protein [uncultured Clostridium sp.]|uniref:hypothetical protein n=1 Tax=uncultured Clostridium sp. TaxID=59620 RepID=UPI0025FA0046|nr:hypothetical protein [uncultured Clostridium sp.]